jgi:multidrug efflux pump subunit AcrA (membrane-fusion protein)
MIEQAEADLRQAEAQDEQAEAELRRAEAARAATQAEVAKMRGVLDWLRQHGRPQERPPASPPATPDRPAPTMNQSELSLWMLGKLGGSASTTAIRENLEREGYPYDQTKVRAALKYLARKGKIHGSSSAWSLPGTDAAAPFPAAAMTGILALNGAGRES